MPRRALTATIRVLLNPEVIGPDAPTEWGGPRSDAAAADWTSEFLSNHPDVLDWTYIAHAPNHIGDTYGWEIVEIPEPYDEGDFLDLLPTAGTGTGTTANPPA